MLGLALGPCNMNRWGGPQLLGRREKEWGGREERLLRGGARCHAEGTEEDCNRGMSKQMEEGIITPWVTEPEIIEVGLKSWSSVLCLSLQIMLICFSWKWEVGSAACAPCIKPRVFVLRCIPALFIFNFET